MKILIATDGSSFSDAAVRAVARRPWPTGSEFQVLSIMEHNLIDSMGSANYAIKWHDLQQSVHDAIEKIASSSADILKSEGHKVSYKVREGNVAEQITDEAKEWGADLIVVGTHGLSGIKRFLLGSIAQKVAHHAPCSVEIVRSSEPTTA